MRQLPLACDPSAFASAESFATHTTEGHRLLSLALDRREVADGWALRLPNDGDTLISIAHWIVDERRCCPFLTFGLECEPDPGGLWLRITGPEGSKDVLRAELG
jgi:hypothetical protein